jgi:comEA protein
VILLSTVEHSSTFLQFQGGLNARTENAHQLLHGFVPRFGSSGRAIDADASGKVNINKATKEQLIELPGIGPALAERIIEHRSAKPFKSIDELKDVKGIGDAKYDKIKDLITI